MIAFWPTDRALSQKIEAERARGDLSYQGANLVFEDSEYRVQSLARVNYNITRSRHPGVSMHVHSTALSDNEKMFAGMLSVIGVLLAEPRAIIPISSEWNYLVRISDVTLVSSDAAARIAKNHTIRSGHTPPQTMLAYGRVVVPRLHPAPASINRSRPGFRVLVAFGSKMAMMPEGVDQFCLPAGGLAY